MSCLSLEKNYIKNLKVDVLSTKNSETVINRDGIYTNNVTVYNKLTPDSNPPEENITIGNSSILFDSTKTNDTLYLGKQNGYYQIKLGDNDNYTEILKGHVNTNSIDTQNIYVYDCCLFPPAEDGGNYTEISKEGIYTDTITINKTTSPDGTAIDTTVINENGIAVNEADITINDKSVLQYMNRQDKIEDGVLKYYSVSVSKVVDGVLTIPNNYDEETGCYKTIVQVYINNNQIEVPIKYQGENNDTIVIDFYNPSIDDVTKIYGGAFNDNSSIIKLLASVSRDVDESLV